MFTRPFLLPSYFPSFDEDSMWADWHELMQQQQHLMQRMRQRQAQAQAQVDSQPPTRRIQPTNTSNAQLEHKYEEKALNEQQQQQQSATVKPSSSSQVATTSQPSGSSSSSSSSSGTVAAAAGSGVGRVGPIGRPRSFWDLTSFPSWSGLTPQSIRLEWSGTEASSPEYLVSAYLPDGMSPSDVSLSVDERTRMLTVKCQQQSHEEEKDKDGHIISSRSAESFTQRALQLPQDVDLSAISAAAGANQAAGATPQLVLHLPKLAKPAPQPGIKQIAIR